MKFINSRISGERRDVFETSRGPWIRRSTPWTSLCLFSFFFLSRQLSSALFQGAEASTRTRSHQVRTHVAFHQNARGDRQKTSSASITAAAAVGRSEEEGATILSVDVSEKKKRRAEQHHGSPPCVSAILKTALISPVAVVVASKPDPKVLVTSSATSMSQREQQQKQWEQLQQGKSPHHQEHGATTATNSSTTFSSSPRSLEKIAIDRVYVTHYTRIPSRIVTTSARLARHGLAEIAAAVRGFDKEVVTKEIIDCFFARDDIWPPLRPGEQSLGLKFYGALHDIAMRSSSSKNSDEETIKNALIVEDDIWMGDDASSSFDEYFANVLRALPTDYDVVHLGDCLGFKDMWRNKFVASGLAKPVSEHGNARIFVATNAPCSHAMLVSRKGALKLLQHALPMTRPLDQHIEYYTKNVTLLNAYYSERDLFWQESQQSRSGKLVESTGIRDR